MRNAERRVAIDIEKETYAIGNVGRSHGTKGEVAINLKDTEVKLEVGDCVFISCDGLLVPFFIEEWRFKNDAVALVKLCNIDTINATACLIGKEVRLLRDANNDDDHVPSEYERVGYNIINVSDGRSIGVIKEIDNSTMNTLYVLESGMLVPATEELIVRIDSEKMQVVMALPDGLIDN